MKIDHTLRIIAIISTVVGLVDSLYLTYIKLAHTQALCLPGIGDCETVNTSRYSEVFGIPVAVFGALLYAVLLVFLLLEDRSFMGIPVQRETSLLASFGLSFFGLLFSAYLTYIEIAVLRAICPFCLISAIAMLAVFICSIIRLVKNQN
jgi:uncharacterized membrane protein